MKWRPRILFDYAGMLGVLAILVVLFGLLSEHFVTSLTLRTVANQIPDLTVMAVGMTLVLIVGGIDLSVGSVLALSGAVLGVLLADRGWPLWLAASVCLMAGLGSGMVNGIVVVRWNLPPFIVTLGMLEVARGGAYLITASQTKYIGRVVEPMTAPLRGLGLSPAFLVAMAMVIAGQMLLSLTVFGRRAVAIGSNEQAAILSGVNPRPVKVAIFAISGALAGLASLFQCSRLAAADPNAGVGMELSAIAAVVIGGTSLMGGRGSVVNSFFGVLIIAVLQAGLAQVGASEPTKRVITGVVIVMAVIIDAYRNGALRKR